MSNSQRDAGYVWEPEFKGFRLPEDHSIDKCRAMDLTQKVYEQPEDTVDPVTKEVTIHDGVLLATAATSVLAQRARQTGGSQRIYDHDGLESVKQAQHGVPQPQGGFMSDNPYFPSAPTDQTMPGFVAPPAGPGGAALAGRPDIQQRLDPAQFGQYPNEQQVHPGQPNAQLPNMPHNAQQHELLRQQVGPDPMPLGPQAQQEAQPQAPQGALVKFIIPLVGEIDASYANVFLSKPDQNFLILISDNRSGQFAFKPPVNREQPIQVHINGGEFSCYAWSHGIHWTYPDGSLSFLTLIIDNTWANRQQQQMPQQPPGGAGSMGGQ